MENSIIEDENHYIIGRVRRWGREYYSFNYKGSADYDSLASDFGDILYRVIIRNRDKKIEVELGDGLKDEQKRSLQTIVEMHNKLVEISNPRHSLDSPFTLSD